MLITGVVESQCCGWLVKILRTCPEQLLLGSQIGMSPDHSSSPIVLSLWKHCRTVRAMSHPSFPTPVVRRSFHLDRMCMRLANVPV